jgi:hypothetical protein
MDIQKPIYSSVGLVGETKLVEGTMAFRIRMDIVSSRNLCHTLLDS